MPHVDSLARTEHRLSARPKLVTHEAPPSSGFEAAVPQLSIGASVQAVRVAIQAEPRLSNLGIQAVPVSRGVVELRGWVPSRIARTVAGRTALAVPGIESVINSILVRGEDDQASEEPRANDQTA